MYRFDEIRHVHLELTTKCNARCPMCARIARGSKAPGLDLTELHVEDVQRILPSTFLAQVTGIDLCGAYGDPAAARDLIEIVAYARSANPKCNITTYTNGGLRSPEWWTQFARALGAPGKVVFAIDGLAGTNEIYRRGVNFEKVIENARAFIAAGGEARWEFLAFKHNENEVQKAQELSRVLGFKEFSVKRTARFLEVKYDHVPGIEPDADWLQFPIYEDGMSVGSLEPPVDPELVNATVARCEALISHYGSLDALFSETPIHCRVLASASVFVSAQGHAYPCCWTYVQATRPRLNGFPAGADRQVYDLVYSTGGFEQIDAGRVGLRRAVESPFFTAVESSWSCSSVEKGRLRVCARACGTEFPAYFDQFSDTSLLPRGLQSAPIPTSVA